MQRALALGYGADLPPSVTWMFVVPSAKQSARPSGPKRNSAAGRDVARTEVLARKFGMVAPDEDPARVAGAIAIFATETIKRSANNLLEARAYLDGLRAGIDGLLKHAFPENREEDGKEDGEEGGKEEEKEPHS